MASMNALPSDPAGELAAADAARLRLTCGAAAPVVVPHLARCRSRDPHRRGGVRHRGPERRRGPRRVRRLPAVRRGRVGAAGAVPPAQRCPGRRVGQPSRAGHVDLVVPGGGRRAGRCRVGRLRGAPLAGRGRGDRRRGGLRRQRAPVVASANHGPGRPRPGRVTDDPVASPTAPWPCVAIVACCWPSLMPAIDPLIHPPARLQLMTMLTAVSDGRVRDPA